MQSITFPPPMAGTAMATSSMGQNRPDVGSSCETGLHGRTHAAMLSRQRGCSLGQPVTGTSGKPIGMRANQSRSRSVVQRIPEWNNAMTVRRSLIPLDGHIRRIDEEMPRHSHPAARDSVRFVHDAQECLTAQRRCGRLFVLVSFI